MSKRITLTNFEREQIVKGLTELRNQPALKYEVVKVGQRFYDSLVKKIELKPGEPGYAESVKEEQN